MRAPRVATIDHRWTAPLGQKLNGQRILKQCCCRFREMGSKITLEAWYVKRLPTVAYVGAWLINSQATNHEPYQKCRPAKNFIFKQTRRVSGAKTLQQKPSQFHQKADPVLGSKKRTPFGPHVKSPCAKIWLSERFKKNAPIRVFWVQNDTDCTDDTAQRTIDAEINYSIH